MKISIDGGALCSPGYKRFGTYTFTMSILQALSQYDGANSYYIYSFGNKPSQLSLASNMFYKVLLPKVLWMKARVSFEELVARKDVFLALNQAVPLFTKARIISFSHGLSYLHFPRLYGYGYIQLLNQLQGMMKRADVIVVSSEKVKRELAMKYPKREKDIVTLPFGIPYDMNGTVTRKRQPYFLFVGSNHPIKNVQLLIEIFEGFIKDKRFSHYELYLVGPFNALKKKHQNIKVFTKMPRLQLQTLYQQSSAYITASLYESFNVPVLEALSQKCPVVGLHTAIIPELAPFCTVVQNKEVFIHQLSRLVSQGSNSVDLASLKEKFSWKTYVHEITKHYAK